MKLFWIQDEGLARGGVSGTVHFVDYNGESGGMVEFTIPQRITSAQKPTLILHGNSADDFSWHVYQNSDSNGNGYDVFIQTPDYHVGLTFMIRGYGYTSFFQETVPGSGYGLEFG